MKKIKFTGKLSLNKETVSKLNHEQMNQVNGGTGSGCTGSRYCATDNTCQPPPTLTRNCPSLLVTGCCTTPEFAC